MGSRLVGVATCTSRRRSSIWIASGLSGRTRRTLLKACGHAREARPDRLRARVRRGLRAGRGGPAALGRALPAAVDDARALRGPLRAAAGAAATADRRRPAALARGGRVDARLQPPD